MSVTGLSNHSLPTIRPTLALSISQVPCRISLASRTFWQFGHIILDVSFFLRSVPEMTTRLIIDVYAEGDAIDCHALFVNRLALNSGRICAG